MSAFLFAWLPGYTSLIETAAVPATTLDTVRILFGWLTGLLFNALSLFCGNSSADRIAQIPEAKMCTTRKAPSRQFLSLVGARLSACGVRCLRSKIIQPARTHKHRLDSHERRRCRVHCNDLCPCDDRKSRRRRRPSPALPMRPPPLLLRLIQSARRRSAARERIRESMVHILQCSCCRRRLFSFAAAAAFHAG